ncbi:MAG: RNA polymerase sigma factor [Chloroflexota bacterium]
MLPKFEHQPESFEDLYVSYQCAIETHLVRLVSDPEVAADLSQDTFLKAMRNWDKRDSSASPVAWLYRIATNTAYDYLRRRKRIRFISIDNTPGTLNTATTPAPQVDEQGPVHEALAQLPSKYKLPLILHSCAGHTVGEIADALGCTDSAIKTRLFRARESFRQVYQG